MFDDIQKILATLEAVRGERDALQAQLVEAKDEIARLELRAIVPDSYVMQMADMKAEIASLRTELDRFKVLAKKWAEDK